MENETRQKKIAVIGDLTGYGRCALTVSIPILSAFSYQVCPVPTAILSNHTGFSSFFLKDMTEQLPSYFTEWEKLSLSFDGILTGFLSSVEQVDLIIHFLKRFKTRNTVLIVDPVMGDNGRSYKTISRKHCLEMRKLSALSDILTPNLTEACLLTDTTYHDNFTLKELKILSDKLLQKEGQKLVITGIERTERIGSFYAVKEHGALTTGFCVNKKIAGLRCGTGDVFSSLIAADALSEVPFCDSVRRAGRFVRKCLKASEQRGIEKENGVCFETFLKLSL